MGANARSLELRYDALSDKQLTILEDSGNRAEWRIGYLGSTPALGDNEGRWYLVPEDAIVPHSSQQLVWLLQENQWSCIHQMHWNASLIPATSPDSWLKNGPAYIES